MQESMDDIRALPAVTPQEPVLDKIRAEIEAKCCITVGRENDGAITLHDVFEIIDKYKAETAHDVVQEIVKNTGIVDL